MLGRLRRALGLGESSRAEGELAPKAALPPPSTVSVLGETLALIDHLHWTEGLPHADWPAVQQWVDSFADPASQREAWAQCERAWLAHLGLALGPHYGMRSQGQSLLLSSLDARAAQVVLDYADRSKGRVLRVLDGIAADEDAGHDIVVLFDDEQAYYRYVSHYYPQAGEFAFSGGMCIHEGCVHFVSVKHEQHALEPVIAHETTHALLTHLPLPLWLNEGLAVNTERQVSPPLAGPRHADVSPQQMHRRHRAFWGADEIQQFWSGESFARADQGNELSYDLARILVEQFAADWPRFAPFVNAARSDDGGDAAARQHLGLSLGEALAALLERDQVADCAPRSDAWSGVQTEPT